MNATLSRRSFVLGAGASLAVVGFDPVSRSWVTKAHAQGRNLLRIPNLDGTLRLDPAALEEASTDFGRLVFRTPRAVLEPGSVEDIQRVVRFALGQNIGVAMRGQGHSVLGQAQAEAGIVIDSRALASIHEITSNSIWVDAGVTWRDLVLATLQRGLSPRSLTDFLGLSVGGVLSVGGIGGAANRFGLVVDNCLELEVVTGQGRLVRCSPSHHRDLFESVLGGLGQFGIIVRARIPLVAAPTLARIYQLTYTNLDAYLADQRRLAADERFDFLEGQVVQNPAGGWIYVIEAAAWYSPPNAPNDATLLQGLTPHAPPEIVDVPYFGWLDRVSPFVDLWKAFGVWETPHPWSDLFLPDRSIGAYAGSVLANLTPADLGPGVILLYPFKRSRLTRPFVKVPDDRVIWLFDILRFSPNLAVGRAHLADNRRLYDAARAAGGTRYPISAVQFSPEDWVRHYGNLWPAFQLQKVRYDPRAILAPGQGIFRSC